MSDQQGLPWIAGLLQALPGEAPSGSDLRQDVTPQSLYFRLRDARAAARAEERNADNDPAVLETGSRHWKTVRDLAVEALGKSTKDIEIAAWLTESLVRSDGLAGLAAGADLLGGLVDRFWAHGLFPLPDEDGIEGRVATIAGLNGQAGDGTLLQPLRKIVLFEQDSGQAVSFWQFEQAEEVSGIGDAARRNQRLASGVLRLAELEAQARTLGRERLAAIGRDAMRAVSAWISLETVLSAAAQDAAPSMRRVHDLLDKLRRLCERYAGAIELPAQAGAGSADAAEPTSPAAPDPATPRLPSGPDGDRETLLAEISRIATLFRLREPNAPIGYTLDEAVRRARLGWPELLKEMMPDAAPRSALLSSLGIKPTPD